MVLANEEFEEAALLVLRREIRDGFIRELNSHNEAKNLLYRIASACLHLSRNGRSAQFHVTGTFKKELREVSRNPGIKKLVSKALEDPPNFSRWLGGFKSLQGSVAALNKAQPSIPKGGLDIYYRNYDSKFVLRQRNYLSGFAKDVLALVNPANEGK